MDDRWWVNPKTGERTLLPSHMKICKCGMRTLGETCMRCRESYCKVCKGRFIPERKGQDTCRKCRRKEKLKMAKTKKKAKKSKKACK